MNVNIVLVPSMIRGGDASACNQNETHEIETIIIDGKK